jgi:hypothetical protein
MNAFEHLGEAAELYAIGALDAAERKAIDRHVGQCADCTSLLREAEERVATLAQADVQHMPPAQLERRITAITRGGAARLRVSVAAIAAALAIGLLPSAYFWQQSQAMHAAMIADADAMNRLASMPHRSVAFSDMSGGSAARVTYAPDGSWYVVLVRGASRALSVAWMHDGKRTMLGTATPHGEVAMLYLPKSHRMDQLALMDGDRVVAEAQLAY